jgi:serine acetyltransferase
LSAGRRTAFRQWSCLAEDARRLMYNGGKRHWMFFLSKNFFAVFAYRFSRFCYLFLGPLYTPCRVLFFPWILLVRPWFALCDIPCQADIGPGLLIVHPTLGVAVAPWAVVGRNLTLYGGNVIGDNSKCRRSGDILFGDDVLMGAGAKTIGKVRIGDRVKIGANALVIRDLPDGVTVVTAPAQVLNRP